MNGIRVVGSNHTHNTRAVESARAAYRAFETPWPRGYLYRVSEATATAYSVSISDRAREEIRRLAPDGGFLRLWVTEGGCSGMTYQASIDETRTPFDVVVYDRDGVTLLADRDSARHLQHLDVDYSDDLVSMGFRFSNPHATKACGCGASFAL